MNGNGFVLEPTKLYLSVVDPKIGQRMKAKMRSLSFKERRETRLQEIKSALESSRKDGGKLIIDLPHSSGLDPEERALLEREAFCVLAHQLKSHSIIEVLHDAEACKGWKVVTSLVVNAGANRSTS